VRYLLLIADDESKVLRPEEVEVMPEHRQWLERAREMFVAGAKLRPAADATSVRVRDGQTLIADGPFAETKEIVGGFVLLECADLDEALELAAAHPVAAYGTVEVRPLWE
jgi:hypothetical protein